METQIGIIGLGLIGGSLAISLRKKGIAGKIVSSFYSDEETTIALEKGLVDEVLQFEEVCRK